MTGRDADLMVGTEALGVGWGCGLSISPEMTPLPTGKRDLDYTNASPIFLNPFSDGEFTTTYSHWPPSGQH